MSRIKAMIIIMAFIFPVAIGCVYNYIKARDVS